MKVAVTRKWSGRAPRVMTAAAALTPDPNDYNDTIDSLAADVSSLQDIIGRLLAHMLEREAVTLDEAKAIVGLYGCDLALHEPGTYGED